MQPRLSIHVVLLIFTLVAFTTGVGHAQAGTPDQGAKPLDATQGGSLDSVSLTTGDLSIHIPLASFPQRGQSSLSFFARLTGIQWTAQMINAHDCLSQTLPDPPPCEWQWRPSFGVPGVQIVSSTDWSLQQLNANPEGVFGGVPPDVIQIDSVVSPDGNGHMLGVVNSGTFSAERSLDATGLLYSMNTTTLITPDGTAYKYANGPASNQGGQQPASITDANGNRITISSSGWTDTLGRVIPGSTGVGPAYFTVAGVSTSDLSTCPSGTVSARIWQIPGPAGSTRAFKFCSSNFTLQTAFEQSPDAVGLGTMEYGPASQPMISAIVLPDLTMWTFNYDNYGNLTRIGLPTGGSISYSYQIGGAPACSFAAPNDAGAASFSVVTRTVDANDGAGGHTWAYSYNGTVTVTDPLGNDAVHTLVSPVSGACGVYDGQTQYYQGRAASGALLKTVATQYAGIAAQGFGFGSFGPPAINVVPTQVTTTLPGGQTTKLVYTYDSGSADGTGVLLGSLLRTDQYDFSGSLVRSVVNRYVWQDNSNYLTANFVALTSSTTVLDSSGNRVAQSTSAYDEVAVASSGVTTSLVPPPGGSIRGNLTTASQWLNTSNSMISSHAVYFDTGTLASASDPLGNATSYGYSCAGAFQSQTTLPDTNGVHHVRSGVYDCNTGLLSSSTDQNGQVVSYQYDNMLRLKQTNYPDGGQMNFNFPDPTTVERVRKIDSSRNDDYFVHFDGLGRSIQTQALTPTGSVFSNTTYDGLGRVLSVTNPYYSTSDPTYGVTQAGYDALDRVVKITKPDSSVATIQYTNNCALATDEAGKVRNSCVDALGHLVEVDEPSAVPVGTDASGTVTINGNLQSVLTGGANGTAATGSVTISPSTGGDRSTQVTVSPGSSASLVITVNGADGTNTVSTTIQVCHIVAGRMICGPVTTTTHPADTGSMAYTVNAGGTIINSGSVSYNGNSTQASLASALAGALPGNSLVHASYNGGNSFTLSSNIGSAGNGYTAAISVSSSCVSGTSGPVKTTCGAQGWSFAPSSGTFSGGADPVSQTVYDSGTVTITVNGHNNQVAFAQNDTAASIASNLVNAINGDSSAAVTASLSGTSVNLTSKATGTAANEPLASSYTFDTTHFSTANFTSASSGTTLTGGTNGTSGTTVYDAGTISLSVAGFTASVQYGQNSNSTAAQVASALATALGSSAPVNASASGASITLTYKTPGTQGNVAVTGSSSTSQTQYFSSPSFSSPGTTLSGGTDPQGGLANPYVTLYSYDLLGNLLSVNQKGDGSQAPRVRNFQYDSLSRLLTTINPESGTIGYTYDNNGRVTQKTAPAPNQTGSATVTTAYNYDALSRLISKTHSDGTTPSTQFVYDVSAGWGSPIGPQTNIIGRLTQAYNFTSTGVMTSAAIFGYDPVGRVNQNSQCTPMNCGVSAFSVNYNYDYLGDVTSYTTGPGVLFSQTFDTAERLTQLASSISDAQHPGTLATVDPAIGYYAAGAVRKLTLANGLTQTAAFNNLLQPCRINVNSSGIALAQCADQIPGGNVQDFHFDFNAGGTDNGNLSFFSASGAQNFGRSYTYDALNRLQTMSAPGDACSGLNWTYDPWGNRNAQSATGGTCFTFQVSSDGNNRLVGFSYDAAGNILNDGNHTYTYDAENRIIQVDGGQTATYTYDALGRRVEKVSGSTKTDYIYGAGGKVVTEYNNGCASICWATSYIYFAGRLTAIYKDATTYFVHGDHLGSTRLMTKLDQTLEDSMDYQPFGEQIHGGSGTTHKLTDQERDAESNLDYFGARYYSSSLGRFTSADWSAIPMPVPYAGLLNPQTLNLYAYAGNNPTGAVDPDGHNYAGMDGLDRDTSGGFVMATAYVKGGVGTPESAGLTSNIMMLTELQHDVQIQRDGYATVDVITDVTRPDGTHKYSRSAHIEPGGTSTWEEALGLLSGGSPDGSPDGTARGNGRSISAVQAERNRRYDECMSGKLGTAVHISDWIAFGGAVLDHVSGKVVEHAKDDLANSAFDLVEDIGLNDGANEVTIRAEIAAIGSRIRQAGLLNTIGWSVTLATASFSVFARGYCYWNAHE